MLIATKSQVEIDRLKAQLSKEFKMKDFGEAKKILGMEINRDRERGKLWLEAVFAEGTTTFWYTRSYKTCKYSTCSSFEIE